METKVNWKLRISLVDASLRISLEDAEPLPTLIVFSSIHPCLLLYLISNQLTEESEKLIIDCTSTNKLSQNRRLRLRLGNFEHTF